MLLIVAFALSGCATAAAPPAPAAQLAGGQVAADRVAGDATYWPVVLEAAEGQVEVYQPQPEAMNGDTLSARAAVSLTRPGAAAPTFGAAWFTARVAADRDTRTATIRAVTVTDVRLPGATAAEQQDFARAIGGRLSAAEVTFPLDQLTASLDTARQEQVEAEHLQTAPPHILFSTTPATLISVNGPPRLQPLEGSPGVSRVANTPFILLFENAGLRYYLKAGARWASAAELTGPWADAADVPPAIAAAGAALATPATQPTTAVGGAAAAPAAAKLAPPAADAKILVATEPTELVVTAGNPEFAPVTGGAGGAAAAAGGVGGELLYASNTASDLFLDSTDHRYYVLLSGRWYVAASLQGPWQYVASNQLPPAFAQIPADSPKADVLAFVAATPEAHEAVLDAGIPQTAAVRRDAGADLSVAYDGEPRFQDVPESPGVAYALNTPEDVLRVHGRYYCCHQGVWYESAAPTGPWAVSTSVPPAVYTLPPSCPAYHVKYVYVYDYSLDSVTCGYLPGYTGTYVYGPTIVYGTGYNYPGWFGTAYFPPPCTWGYSAYYDPYAYAWGFDAGLYWGDGWFAHPWRERWWRDHPGERWGSHRWWGPGGFVHSHEVRGHLFDARSGGSASRIGGGDAALGARLPGMNHGGSGWSNLYARDGNAGRNMPAARRGSSTALRVGTGGQDNVFAGSDGHVYRRSGAGWEAHGGMGGSWAGVDRVPDAHPSYRPSPGPAHFGGSFASPQAGLDQHYAARSRGTFRSGAMQSGGGGGFRGGGGGFHGGGGSRGGGGRR